MGVTLILARKQSTDSDTTLDSLGLTISSHTMRFFFPRETIGAIKKLPFKQCPQSGREATARDVLSMAGNLLNTKYVVRTGRYSVWRLLRLIRVHNSGGKNKQNSTIGLGREFYTDLLFWESTIDHELLHECEALSAPGYTVIQNPAKRYYLSDASFEAVGCIFVKRMGFS